MESCFILSLVLSFAFTVFNASGRYLLVEVGAEMETIPRTLDNGKHIAFKSFAHYFYFHQVHWYELVRYIYNIFQRYISPIVPEISFSFSVNDNKNSNTSALHASSGRSLSTRVKGLNPMNVGDTQAINVEPSKKDCQLRQREYYVRK